MHQKFQNDKGSVTIFCCMLACSEPTALVVVKRIIVSAVLQCVHILIAKQVCLGTSSLAAVLFVN